MTDNDVMLSVLVCRGCCCGTEDGPEPARHVAQLEAAVAAAGGRLKITNCIGPCDRKNVVVVRGRSETRRWTARYYGGVGQAEVDSLCDWLAGDPLSGPSGRFAVGPEPANLSAAAFPWPLPRPLPR